MLDISKVKGHAARVMLKTVKIIKMGLKLTLFLFPLCKKVKEVHNYDSLYFVDVSLLVQC